MDTLAPFLLLAAGFLASRTKLLKDEAFEQMPNFLFALCYPSLIMTTIAQVHFLRMLSENGYIVAFAFLSILGMMLGGRLAARRFEGEAQKAVIILALMLNNTSYAGLPVMEYLFGQRGVYFLILYGSVQDLFLWTVGYRLFDKEKPRSIFGFLKNPCLAALGAGLVLSVIGVPSIPYIGPVLQTIGGMTVPIALLHVGHMIDRESRVLFRIRRDVLVCSLLKVWIFPLLAALALWMLPIDTSLKAMSVVITATPAPVIAVIFAKQFGKDTNLATHMLLWSTLIYIITLMLAVPLWKWQPALTALG